MRYLRFLPSTSTKRLLIVVVITGLAGGAVGAAYLAVLRVLTNVLGPDAWTSPAHLLVLVVVGAVPVSVTFSSWPRARRRTG